MLIYVVAASSLAQNRQDLGTDTGAPVGSSGWLRIRVNRTGTSTPFWWTVPVGSHQEDMAVLVVNRITFLDWAGSTCFT